MKKFTYLIVLVAISVLSTSSVHAQSVDFRAAIRKAESVVTTATFSLGANEDAERAQRALRQLAPRASEVVSTAFAVGDDLLLAYVGRPAESVVLENAKGEVVEASVVCLDYVTGLAVIKAEAELIDGLVISSAELEAGLPIVSLSMRDGVLTANSGMVSTQPTPSNAMGLLPKVEFIGESPANGAPVLDSEGIVVGVMIPSRGELVCVPAPAVLRLVETAMGRNPKDLKRGLVGLQFEEQGPLVMQVAEDSAASLAGFKGRRPCRQRRSCRCRNLRGCCRGGGSRSSR